MKQLAAVSALALLIATTGEATAADPYAGSMKDPLPPVLTTTNWTGFYLGVNAGGAWTQLDSSFTATDPEGGDSLTINHTNEAVGALGGGQIGYNYQTGAFVFGVEADFDYLGIDHTRNIIEANWGYNNLALGTKLEGGLLADVTGRLGVASGPALFYVKGGWAYFGGSAGTSGINALQWPGIMDMSKSGFNGWTIGGGIEYLITPAWSIKGEYQHYDFGNFDLMPVAFDPTIVIRNTLTVDTVKVGLNYHVGSTYAPLK